MSLQVSTEQLRLISGLISHVARYLDSGCPRAAHEAGMLLRELDAQWARHAPLATFSPRQRFIAAVRSLRDAGWPVHGGVARWRLGELTVDWSAVAPRA